MGGDPFTSGPPMIKENFSHDLHWINISFVGFVPEIVFFFRRNPFLEHPSNSHDHIVKNYKASSNISHLYQRLFFCKYFLHQKNSPPFGYSLTKEPEGRHLGWIFWCMGVPCDLQKSNEKQLFPIIKYKAFNLQKRGLSFTQKKSYYF